MFTGLLLIGIAVFAAGYIACFEITEWRRDRAAGRDQRAAWYDEAMADRAERGAPNPVGPAYDDDDQDDYDPLEAATMAAGAAELPDPDETLDPVAHAVRTLIRDTQNPAYWWPENQHKLSLIRRAEAGTPASAGVFDAGPARYQSWLAGGQHYVAEMVAREEANRAAWLTLLSETWPGSPAQVTQARAAIRVLAAA